MFCLSCVEEFEEMFPVIFMYQAPGDDGMGVVAYLCRTCTEECKNDNKFFAIESIVNARLARVRNPGKTYGSNVGP